MPSRPAPAIRQGFRRRPSQRIVANRRLPAALRSPNNRHRNRSREGRHRHSASDHRSDTLRSSSSLPFPWKPDWRLRVMSAMGGKRTLRRYQRGMADEIVQTIDHPFGTRRVIIVRRADGRFAYRWQNRCGSGWSAASIDAGVYNSAETAEMEARQREQWLKDLFQ